MDYLPAMMRWLHLMAGVMWIGLLYYFNFVQVAALKAAAADSTAAGITRHVIFLSLVGFGNLACGSGFARILFWRRIYAAGWSRTYRNRRMGGNYHAV
jgi:hypothetical protein